MPPTDQQSPGDLPPPKGGVYQSNQPAYLPLREKEDLPRRYRRITAEEKTRILEMHGEGASPSRIGRLLDRDPAIVRRILNEAGVSTPKLRWDAHTAMRLLDQGVPPDEVSRTVGKPVAAIRQYAVRHGRKA
jgi:transposase-like protein